MMIYTARLEHIVGNEFRMFFFENGKCVDIHEFSGTSVCNGYNPFKLSKTINTPDFECNNWKVDYGKATLPMAKMIKAIIQCPFGLPS